MSTRFANIFALAAALVSIHLNAPLAWSSPLVQCEIGALNSDSKLTSENALQRAPSDQELSYSTRGRGVRPVVLSQIKQLKLRPEQIVDVTGADLDPPGIPQRTPRFSYSSDPKPTRLHVNDILFMQDYCSNPTKNGNYLVTDNAVQLRNGTLSPRELPKIRVWRDTEGRIWSLDHRRLASLILGGIDQVDVIWVNSAKVRANGFKFSTASGGRNIIVYLGNGKGLLVERPAH